LITSKIAAMTIRIGTNSDRAEEGRFIQIWSYDERLNAGQPAKQFIVISMSGRKHPATCFKAACLRLRAGRAALQWCVMCCRVPGQPIPL
jgi:hypothetical protein